MSKFNIAIIPLIVLTALMSSGCGGAEGNLGDFLGWHSLGGRWEGTLQLSDGRDIPMAITFTEFDGENFHGKVEAGVGAELISNESDGTYAQIDRSFLLNLPRFLQGPCEITGQLVTKYSITGTMDVSLSPETLAGNYEVAFVE